MRIKLGKNGKTETGKDAAVVETEPKAKEIDIMAKYDYILRHGWCTCRLQNCLVVKVNGMSINKWMNIPSSQQKWERIKNNSTFWHNLFTGC